MCCVRVGSNARHFFDLKCRYYMGDFLSLLNLVIASFLTIMFTLNRN
jgi:hypothetical protein